MVVEAAVVVVHDDVTEEVEDPHHYQVERAHHLGDDSPDDVDTLGLRKRALPTTWEKPKDRPWQHDQHVMQQHLLLLDMEDDGFVDDECLLLVNV